MSDAKCRSVVGFRTYQPHCTLTDSGNLAPALRGLTPRFGIPQPPRKNLITANGGTSTAPSKGLAPAAVKPKGSAPSAYDIRPRAFTPSPQVAVQLAEQQQESENGVAAQAIVVPAQSGILAADPDTTATPSWSSTTEGSVAYPKYGTHLHQRARVVAAPKDGVLDLTVCLSLSGHVGSAELEAYALQDTHYLTVTFPDGHVERIDAIRGTPAGQREIVTSQNISIRLAQRGVYTIAGSPTPTSPDGYPEGRITEIRY